MSFSGSIRVGVGLSGGALLAAVGALVVSGNEDASVERDAVVALAKDAAVKAIEGGFAGGKGDEIEISITGHVNPENTPRANWGNDFLQLTLHQVAPRVEETAPETTAVPIEPAPEVFETGNEIENGEPGGEGIEQAAEVATEE